MKSRHIIASTYINELLKVLVEVGQIILALLILRDQGLLVLQQLLTSLLKFLSLRMLVIDARNHQVMFICLAVFGEELEEFLDGCQWQ